jgi:hypothetical protein
VRDRIREDMLYMGVVLRSWLGRPRRCRFWRLFVHSWRRSAWNSADHGPGGVC